LEPGVAVGGPHDAVSDGDESNAAAERAPVILLPGIVLPAAIRYAPLLAALGDAAYAVTKELEVYATSTPPEGYSIEREVAGISQTADAAGMRRFHLYGHSAGGAIAIAYTVAHPDRVLTLALDEPASDFSPQRRAELREDFKRIERLPAAERLRAFLQMQLAPGVEPPRPPPGPPPAWMEQRPAGIAAFGGALDRFRLAPERLRTFPRPVYFSYGDLSAPCWTGMKERLAALFADFTSELYEGTHHLNPSHQRDPARVAVTLNELWRRPETMRA
jgi:pimeloyl-ACP methyl ester carboxylesterase